MKLFQASQSKNVWLILMLLIGFHYYSAAQEKTSHYDVIRNGNVIGYLNVTQKVKDSFIYLRLQSEVKASLLFYSYDCKTIEDAVFVNGAMVYSWYYKKENGKEVSIHTKKSNGYFKVVNNGDKGFQSYSSLDNNMLQLYGNSPGTDIKVYSNHFQQLLDLKKVAENTYRLTLPDGNSNYYHYKNGICTQVDVERALFTIHFVLRKQN
jgi:hypothetical protein